MSSILGWPGRRRLRHYLERLEHAVAIQDLNARETGLGEIRAALRADLVQEQISEDHYMVALGHLDEAVKATRIQCIENVFQELPFHVVQVLQEVLDDGRIDPEEIEMMDRLMEREALPLEDRQRVLTRLERWRLLDEVGQV